jgi:hypothetical protein
MQAMFVGAFGGIHNYVRIHDPSDSIESWTNINANGVGHSTSANRTPQEPNHTQVEQLGFNITAAERRRAADRRDIIAAKMWEDYQKILEEREDDYNKD